MNLYNGDAALEFLYTKYLNTKTNNFISKPPREIVQEPYLRNFYAGIKQSSIQYIYLQHHNNKDGAYNNFEINIENQNRFKAYRRPIKENKRLCPWNERKLPKHRNNMKKQKNRIKKYSSSHF